MWIRELTKQISIVAFVLGGASLSYGRTGDTPSYHNSLAKTFGVVAGNPSPELKQDIFNELLGTTETNGLNFPAFPRSWIQHDISEWEDAKASFGFKLSLAVGIEGAKVGDISYGKKVSVDYKYNKRVSFVAITTVDASMGLNPGNGVLAGRLNTSDYDSNPALESIRTFNPDTQRNYFKVSAAKPMVGFCVYELQLTISTSEEHSGSLVLIDGSVGKGRTETTTQAVYSKFFQIDGTIPEMDYVDIKCNKYFHGMVKPYVENDFNKIIFEYWSWRHPNNQCVTTLDKAPGGDQTCAAFHAQHDSGTRATTTARCERAQDGFNRCVLKSNNKGTCPLFQKKNGGGLTPNINEAARVWTRAGQTGNVIDATYNWGSRPCDAGLTCTLTQDKPFGPFGFMFQQLAVCK